MFKVVHYYTESGKDLVKEYIDDTSKKYGVKDVANIKLAIKLLEKYGFDANKYRNNIIKTVDGDICELRPGKNRVFFFYFDKDNDNKFVLLHGFRKKTQKTPDSEKKLAKKQMNDYIRRSKK